MNENCNIRRSGGGSGAITLRDVATGRCCADYSVSNAQYAGAGFRGSVENGGDAAQRTGCVPNRVAGGLASSRIRLTAALVPGTVMSVFVETVESLSRALFDAGYQLMLGQSGYSVDCQESLIEAMISRRPDGLFLAGIMKSWQGRTRLLVARIPQV